MGKIITEIYVPAAAKTFDIAIPTDSPLSEVTDLVAEALSELLNGQYQKDPLAVLCDRRTGDILNINMKIWELDLENGSQLMLI